MAWREMLQLGVHGARQGFRSLGRAAGNAVASRQLMTATEAQGVMPTLRRVEGSVEKFSSFGRRSFTSMPPLVGPLGDSFDDPSLSPARQLHSTPAATSIKVISTGELQVPHEVVTMSSGQTIDVTKVISTLFPRLDPTTTKAKDIGVLVLGSTGNIGRNMFTHAQELGFDMHTVDHHEAVGLTEQEKALPTERQSALKKEKTKFLKEAVENLSQLVDITNPLPGEAPEAYVARCFKQSTLPHVTKQVKYAGDMVTSFLRNHIVALAIKPEMFDDQYKPLLQLYQKVVSRLPNPPSTLWVSPMAKVSRDKLQDVLPDQDQVLTMMPVNTPDRLTTSATYIRDSAQKNWGMALASVFVDPHWIRVATSEEAMATSLVAASGPGYVRQLTLNVLPHLGNNPPVETIRDALMKAKEHLQQNKEKPGSREGLSPLVAYYVGIGEGMIARLCDCKDYNRQSSITDVDGIFQSILDEITHSTKDTLAEDLTRGRNKIMSAKGTTAGSVYYVAGASDPVRAVDTEGKRDTEKAIMAARANLVQAINYEALQTALTSPELAYQHGQDIAYRCGSVAVSIGANQADHLSLARGVERK